MSLRSFALSLQSIIQNMNQNMKRNSFEESEVPYQTLAKYGLTHEMIEDLPMHALEDISNGRPSPVLTVSMEVNDG